MDASTSPKPFNLQAKLPLLVLSAVCSWSLLLVQAKTHFYKWEVSYQLKSPDCYRKLAITINGETPGPTIDAQQGDTVVVRVMNSLGTENVSIHWHGIRQFGTPWFDGTEGVTQCPIAPESTFVYRFVVDRAGTYMYHAHYRMQRSAGLYGLIRVAAADGAAEPFYYDDEQSIILSDWWHNSTNDQAVGLLSVPFGWIGEPQSLLINGRGKFNCSLAGSNTVCNPSNPECSPSNLVVVPGKTYRLRIASITSLSALNFEIEGHNLTVVEADGHYVKPFVIKNLNIYSGETYSVVFTADRDASRNYWIAVNVVSRKPGTPTGTAVLNYYPQHSHKLPPTLPPAGPLWNDTMYRFNQSVAVRSHPDFVERPPLAADRTIILLNTQNKINNQIKWCLNNLSLTFPETPYLISLKMKLQNAFDQTPAPATYDYANYDIYSPPKNPNGVTSNSIYWLELNSTVDVILQNANSLNPNNSETHPWHLHGHNFWVLGYGIGKFDPSTDPRRFNLVDPIMKNSVAVYPYGWTALRFRADNPGVWAFHCHVEPHFFMGMGVVFAEGVDKVAGLPPSIMGCGNPK